MSEIPTGPHAHHHPGRYEIRLKGHLGSRWAAWFDGLSLTNDSDGTTIIQGQYAYFLGIYVAPLLMGIALWRSRAVPRWLAVLFFAGLEVAQQQISSGPVVVLYMLPFAAAMVLLAARIWPAAALPATQPQLDGRPTRVAAFRGVSRQRQNRRPGHGRAHQGPGRCPRPAHGLWWQPETSNIFQQTVVRLSMWRTGAS